MRNFYKNSLMLVAALFTCASAMAAETEEGPITTPRSWSFTDGKSLVDEITAGDYWAASSKGRFATTVNLEDQEIPSNTGATLTGLEGIYFTVPSGMLFGVTQNFCVQANKFTVRIPRCGAHDEIMVDFASATSGQEVSCSSENLEPGTLTTTLTAQKEESKQTATVNEDGDVVLNFSGGKGIRLYGISVTPAETTGINNIVAEDGDVVSTQYYNLQGVRVDESYKGVVVKIETLGNGRTVVGKIAK